MQEIVAGWVQQRLMHNFENNALEIALNDCTGEKHQSYSYQELFYEVSKVARNIKYFSGERALLLLPGDSSFIFSYLACLMVGVTAVPVNLPGVKRLQRVKSNIEHILDDCEPNLIVALSATKGEIEKFGWDINREVVYLDELFGEKQPLCWNDLCPPTGPVMLQYSSGSTGSPKAVCNYDKNIYHQFDIMLQVEPSLQYIHTANWLPFYHDLGLFYGLMFPLLSGGTCSFIRPSQFSVEPAKWLNMIEQYQATITAAPDFAYQLCVDSISDLQASELDLSSLKVVMNAAEPIRASTIRSFSQKFESSGFQSSRFLPAYGMAEATLIVSHKPANTSAVMKTFDVGCLAEGHAVESMSGRELVSSGSQFNSWQVEIVDPHTGAACELGQVGEVWVRGNSVAKGYWNKTSLTQQTFNASINSSCDDGEYLRTGDLAFKWGGELYICGRFKDVIIVSGENHMPNDLESTIESMCDDIEVGGACFVQDIESGEIHGLCEVHRHTEQRQLIKISKTIKSLIAKNHSLSVSQVTLIARGCLQKTSSGKIRRSLMLSELQAQKLKPLYISSLPATPAFITDISEYLRNSLEAIVGIELFGDKQGFTDVGLTSLLATQWCAQISSQLGISISPVQLFAYPNLSAFSQFVQQQHRQQSPKELVEEFSSRSTDIAIIAISSRLPKQQNASWVEYADWLIKGESALASVSDELRTFSLPIGAVDNIDKFDANFFAMSSREACLLDPQQRWLMESSWHLFEQAGWLPSKLKGLPLGIFVGQGSQDYSDLLANQNAPEFLKSYLITGTSRSGSSGRLAKYYGTSGPAITIDTACSSSIVAIDMAVQNIQSKRCESAIAGGVNLLLSSQIESALQKAGMLSPNGRCATFSADADGYARAEGLGLLLLKDYDAAIRDGDPILAVIEATGVAQDGESSSLTAPNPLAQQTLLKEVLARSGRTENDIDAIEMHGTGTPLGDPIELSAIDGVYQSRIQPLHLTAGKAQFGHLESAAGVAGVIRAIAQMRAQTVFPHPTFKSFNPELRPWIERYIFENDVRPIPLRRMGVSSFSFTGTLGHIIIRNHQDVTDKSEYVLPKIGFLPLTASHIDSLSQLAKAWIQTIESHRHNAVELFHAWRDKREHHLPIRRCVPFTDIEDLLCKLKQIAVGQSFVPSALPAELEQWCNGADYDWSHFSEKVTYPTEILLALPLYPFKREKYWVEQQNTGSKSNIEEATLPAKSIIDHQAFLTEWLSDVLLIEPGEIGLDADLINLGLDSLQMMDLVDEAKKHNVVFELVRMYEAPTLAAWSALWQSSVSCDQVAEKYLDAKKEQDTETVLTHPFELTSVQQAYWQGRNSTQTLGGVACQVYLELDSEWIDSDKLRLALDRLYARHSMLRMRMNSDGLGYITANAPTQIHEYDWRTLDCELATSKQADLRRNLEAQILDLENESGLAINLSHSPRGSRLHFNIDMVVADALSIQILLDDLAQFYLDDNCEQLAQPTLHFPQYLSAIREQAHVEADRQYWLAQLPSLPSAPQLPLAKRPEEIKQPVFVHREWRLAADKWRALQQACRQHRITPSMMLASCYAETLRGWSDNKDFCLNLTIFNRRHTAMDVSGVVADFTTLMLLACRDGEASNILDNASALNRQFMANLDHSDFDAIRLLRELSKQRGSQVAMPIVFTSNLGNDFLGDSCLGEMNYVISQTPQVWIDCQVMERKGELIISWDTVDDLFPANMVDQMFASMGRLIAEIAQRPNMLKQTVPAFLTEEARKDRASRNSSDVISYAPRTLHQRFFELAEAQPDAIAVIENKASMSYRQLSESAGELAYRLKQEGVLSGDRVAILLPKGASQVVAVLAIHLLGASYVPLDIEQPVARLNQIIEQAAIKIVVINQDAVEAITNQEAMAGWSLLDIDERGQEHIIATQIASVSPHDVAYIIYTSGSTGIPKGVITTHQAAANTIDDINQRYQLVSDCRTFALSALNFDLSVFDIFGPLSVGGCVVVPQQSERKEAKAWISLIHEYQITIWNSVPALFEMLLIAAENDTRQLPSSMTNVLLSGDWVGLDLQPRLNALNPSIQLTALGGATEAAIWSNAFDVNYVETDWTSIPYGYSLSNQSYRVMDALGRDCPDWVIGELWIGGQGVAEGYFADPERTAAQFIFHDGQQYYRTGDMGRFWSNGIVEFIGRRDNQVKLNGFRIELGDVEHAAEQFSGVQKAIALLLDKPQKHIQLFVSKQQGEVSALQTEYEADMTLLDTKVSQPTPPKPVDHTAIEQAMATHVMRLVLDKMVIANNVKPGASLTLDDWLCSLHITPRFQAVFESWLHVLVETKQWSAERGYWRQEQDVVSPMVAYQKKVAHMPAHASILSALENKVDWYVDLMQGEVSEITLIDDPVLTPEALALIHPDFSSTEQYIVETIVLLSKQLGRAVNVVELNGRTGHLASHILNQCDASQVSYCVAEQAKSVLDQATFRLAGYGDHAFACALSDVERHRADLVISNNALHRFNDVNEGINLMSSLIAPSGHFVAIETQALSPLALLTVTLMQPEALMRSVDQSPYNDCRRGESSPLLDAQQWQTSLQTSSLSMNVLPAVNKANLLVMTGRQAETLAVSDTSQLADWLALQLPNYMLPQHIVVCSTMPLTNNGKIDRTQLRLSAANIAMVTHEDKQDCVTDNEKYVAEVWAQVLGVTPSRTDNFFLLGGDSLHATRITAALGEVGFNSVKLSDVFSLPVLSDFARNLEFDAGEISSQITLVHNENERYQPFVLTDVQQAYIMGRNEGFVMGGVGTHFYSEFEADGFDVTRLEQALMRLIERHDTLRIVFDDQGQQVCIPSALYCPMEIVSCTEKQWEEVVTHQREVLSHRVLNPQVWPLFHLTLIESECGKKRLCIGLDNVILDGLSMRIFFAELGILYRDLEADLPELGITFRDYQQQVYLQEEHESQTLAKSYWLSRLPSLPEAPRLPLSMEPNQLEKPRFVRRQSCLSKELWSRLTEKARECAITPSCLLLNCYAQVLAKWSESSSHCINVTLFDRKPVHDNIQHIMGDFTSLLLLETNQIAGESWLQSAERLQQQLWQDLEYADVSAVWVIRELAKLKEVTDLSMPVVFTSALGADTSLDESSELGITRSVWGVSQTPQVWIDHQVFEQDGELHFNWDVVEALFPDGVVDAMFNSYCQLLEQLADCDWSQPSPIALPASQREVRTLVNSTQDVVPLRAMHISVYEKMQATPEATAIVANGQRYKYRDLHTKVSQAAYQLQKHGIAKGDCVGVMLPRSIEQIASVLAIQWIGAAYVPLATDWPKARVESVLAQACIKFVICDRNELFENGGQGINVESLLASEEALVEPLQSTLDELAYVIFTSGSTGTPKGVAITHGAAMNTIEAINRQHNVTADDSVLALSALYFDLSVYDIFGLLSVGGKLVLINDEQTRDVGVWLELVQQHQITLWNTVPALLEMLLMGNESQAECQLLTSLRCVMLSGDWINLELPERLRRNSCLAKFVAMGGATEAAIWSNYCVVQQVEKQWRSIPYGKPLPNQCFRVASDIGDDCPDWVAGELWIGGDGVAQGYIGNKELTQQQFCEHQSQRWYRTGDIGRYWPDGTIEFLGRRDHQVKVAGLRIELGEIVKALKSCAGVKDAIVLIEHHDSRPKIHAYLLSNMAVELSIIQPQLLNYLPSYSMPDGYAVLQEWPLTANGKVDRNVLKTLELSISNESEFVAPSTDEEIVLTQAMQQVLGINTPISASDNFFALGGDSFVAIQLASTLQQQHGITLPLHAVFNLQTISRIALALETSEKESNEVDFEEGTL